MRIALAGFTASLVLLVSACASSLAPPAQTQGALTSTQIAAIDSTVQSAIDSNLVLGVSLALNYNGATYHRAYGYADLEHRLPVTEDTVFWVMSLNKTFTAAAIMRLAERGQLTLDDPLSRHLPDFPHASEVTLRQLLNHTSGVREFLAQPDERRDPLIATMTADPNASLEALLPYMAGMTPGLFEFEPGSAWKYSNSNYILLGAVIERVSGQSWKDYLRQNFFTPLGLRNTDIDSLQDALPNRAHGYQTADDGAFTPASGFPRNIAGPAGSLRSTANDLLAWQLALIEGRALTPASVQAMREPVRLRDRTLVHEARPDWAAPEAEYMYSYGMGFMLLDDGTRQAFGHIGNFPGYEAVVQTYADQGLTIAVLTNRSEAATLLTPRIAQAVLGNAADDCARTISD